MKYSIGVHAPQRTNPNDLNESPDISLNSISWLTGYHPGKLILEEEASCVGAKETKAWCGSWISFKLLPPRHQNEA